MFCRKINKSSGHEKKTPLLFPVVSFPSALKPASKLSEWGLEEEIEKLMRERHGWFVKQAMDAMFPEVNN